MQNVGCGGCRVVRCLRFGRLRSSAHHKEYDQSGDQAGCGDPGDPCGGVSALRCGRLHDGLRRGGDFTGQLLGLCDSALLLAGTNRTRRSELTYARRLAKAAGKPLMGLVTGARTRVMRKELEESRW